MPSVFGSAAPVPGASHRPAVPRRTDHPAAGDCASAPAAGRYDAVEGYRQRASSPWHDAGRGGCDIKVYALAKVSEGRCTVPQNLFH